MAKTTADLVAMFGNFAKDLALMKAPMTAIAAALPLLGKTFGATNDIIRTGGDLGLSLEQAGVEFANVTTGLKESTGMINALGMAMSVQRAGLDGNNLALLKLMNQERLLTGTHQNLLKSFVGLRQQLGLSTEQIASMAEVVQATGDKNLVSTEALLAGLEQLGDTLRTAKLLGQGETLVKGMAEMNMRLPGMSTQIGNFVKTMMDGRADTLRQIGMVGGMAEFQTILQTKSQTAFADALSTLILKFGDKADEQIEGFAGSTAFLPMFLHKFLVPVFGDQIRTAKVLADTIRNTSIADMKGRKKRDIAMQTLAKAWGSFTGKLETFFVPVAAKIIRSVDAIFTELAPSFVDFAKSFTPMIAPFLSAIALFTQFSLWMTSILSGVALIIFDIAGWFAEHILFIKPPTWAADLTKKLEDLVDPASTTQATQVALNKSITSLTNSINAAKGGASTTGQTPPPNPEYEKLIEEFQTLTAEIKKARKGI